LSDDLSLSEVVGKLVVLEHCWFFVPLLGVAVSVSVADYITLWIGGRI